MVTLFDFVSNYLLNYRQWWHLTEKCLVLQYRFTFCFFDDGSDVFRWNTRSIVLVF
jgi:hypothetical protein